MEPTQIVSIIGLSITLVIAIVNIMATRKLETFKKNYDLLYIKYNKLSELREKIAEIRVEGSVKNVMISGMKNEDPRGECVKILHGLESQSHEVECLLLARTHLFPTEIRKEIERKVAERGDFEIEFLKEVDARDKAGDFNDLFFMKCQYHVDSMSELLGILDSEIDRLNKKIEGR